MLLCCGAAGLGATNNEYSGHLRPMSVLGVQNNFDDIWIGDTKIENAHVIAGYEANIDGFNIQPIGLVAKAGAHTSFPLGDKDLTVPVSVAYFDAEKSLNANAGAYYTLLDTDKVSITPSAMFTQTIGETSKSLGTVALNTALKKGALSGKFGEHVIGSAGVSYTTDGNLNYRAFAAYDGSISVNTDTKINGYAGVQLAQTDGIKTLGPVFGVNF